MHSAIRRATRFRLMVSPFFEQILVHTWRSDHAAAVLVDLTNTLHQTRIRLGTRTWRAILPGV
ncbi:hypothetical protein IPC6_17070 [Pseudomonas aeruginosa]|nr:hypothetical protein IPC6_17070 [Pseudomonas aeruginosa]